MGTGARTPGANQTTHYAHWPVVVRQRPPLTQRRDCGVTAQLPQTEFEGAAFKLSGPPGAVRRAGVLLPAYDDAGPCFEVPVL
jgi:hypothetical protein